MWGFGGRGLGGGGSRRGRVNAILDFVSFERRLFGTLQSVFPGTEIIASKPIDNEYFEVQRVNQNRVAEEFAKQLFTTISTLLVAVAGFYFGSKTLSAARSTLADERTQAKAEAKAEAESKAKDEARAKAKAQADAKAKEVAEAKTKKKASADHTQRPVGKG